MRLTQPCKLFKQYLKKNVNFNVNQGECLYFAEDGTCYILKRMEERLPVSEKV